MLTAVSFDIATCMYHTGIDPFTGEEVFTAKHLRDRKLQRALLQFFKPENDFEVRGALLKAGRSDLIGSGCDALTPANPPKAALLTRMEKANRSVTEGQYVHSIPGTTPRTKPAPARDLEGQTFDDMPEQRARGVPAHPARMKMIDAVRRWESEYEPPAGSANGAPERQALLF